MKVSLLAAGIAERRLPVTLLRRRDDVEDLLAAADVVVPSVWEGQPLVVQEALRVAAASVATDVGGCGRRRGTASSWCLPPTPRAVGGGARASHRRHGSRHPA